MIQNVLEQHGVAFLTAQRAHGVAAKENGVQVSMEGGQVLDADIFVVAAGVRSRTSFLEDSGVRIDGGVLVDSRMTTNIPNIWAAGDVASAKGFLTADHGVNPILPNAAEQGKVAGSTIAGRDVEYEGWLPMNTLMFFGHRAVSVGKPLPSDGDEVLVTKDEARGTYKRLIFSGDALVGAAFLDTDGDAGAFQYLIRRRVNLRNHKALLMRDPRGGGRHMVRT